MSVKQYTLTLPYYKQGDDLREHLDESSSPAEAFARFADHMEGIVNTLRNMATMAEDTELEVSADGHNISVSGPDDAIDYYKETYDLPLELDISEDEEDLDSDDYEEEEDIEEVY